MPARFWFAARRDLRPMIFLLLPHGLILRPPFALLECEDRTPLVWYRSFAHLTREGRMTVTIGRRKLLAALGGAAVWPLVARAQQPGKTPRVGYIRAGTPNND